ncbi:MAG: hypothetical protein HFE64_07295 [Lachnospiraceae bacterium]|jgi:hypothetical protein|nr:hypothetical protein [Lachnospiraceae bacterium]
MMKIHIKERNGLNLPLYVPNRFVLMILRRKGILKRKDAMRIGRMLRHYHGLQLIEVKEKEGTEVKIRL